MYKTLIIIAFVYLYFSSCKSQNRDSIWTKNYEKERFHEIYEGSRTAFPDDSQRKALALYTIEKLKSKLPNGVSSVSSDSLQKLFINIMADYIENRKNKSLKIMVPWTLSGEKTLKESLLNGAYLKKIDKKLRNSYCDCLIEKLKENNPNSMNLPPDSTFLKLVRKCDYKIVGVNQHL